MSSRNERIGQMIADIRKEKGISQAQLALELFTSQSAINRIEKGKQNITLDTIARIGDVLNKPLINISPQGSSFRIYGGTRLRGEIVVKTSKNAAVALICASLLNKGRTTLKSVARIEEVYRLLEVLASIGVKVKWVNGNDLEINPPAKLDLDNMNVGAARKTRSVIMFIGSLLHNTSEFKLPYAGGCALGQRSVLPHIYALEEMGISINTKRGYYHISGANKHTPSRPIVLYETGDTTTENILIAAAGFDRPITIKAASANYMVQDVCFFLQSLGVKIEGIGTSTLIVTGIGGVFNKDIVYAPSEDPVEAMTFLSAAIVTDSSILIKRAPIAFLELELLKLEKMGFSYQLSKTYKAENKITDLVDITTHSHHGKLRAAAEKIHPNIYPGLNIDHLPYFVIISAVARGRTLIHDWVYEERPLMYLELKKIGVGIEMADMHRVFVNGPTVFQAADITAPVGIRPAVMLMIGMMAAKGTSVLRNVYTINRGYEDLATRLNSIGARIDILTNI